MIKTTNNGSPAHEKKEKRNPVKQLFLTPENCDKKIQAEEELKKEKINQELPADLIPGQKEFNRKRLEDIENKEKDYIRTRADTSGTKTSSAAMKFVKKIFKKKS